MAEGHNFKLFPELTNSQMQIYYFDSPHKQLIGTFQAKIVKVIDGDTVRLEIDERDFSFPLRMADIAAPELDEPRGPESQRWLSTQIMNEEVTIVLDRSRVEKWGRLLGTIILMGMDINHRSIDEGHATSWEGRKVSPWL